MQQLVRFATTQQRARASCYVMKYDKKSTSVTNPDQFGANFFAEFGKESHKTCKRTQDPDRTRKRGGEFITWIFLQHMPYL